MQRQPDVGKREQQGQRAISKVFFGVAHICLLDLFLFF